MRASPTLSRGFFLRDQEWIESRRQYCGHGVGLEIHEDPQIPNYVSVGPNPRLMPGMVLAIEPMINIGTSDVRGLDDDWTVVTMDGSLSAHFEHTVLVTDSGCEVLNHW
jgi:methionyl aminopeptidase